MVTVTQNYKDLSKGVTRDVDVKVNIAGTDYTSSDIVSFTINEFLVEDDIEIGNSIPSYMEIQLKVTEDLPINAQLIPSVRFLGDTDSEWLQIGEYYIDSRRVDYGRIYTLYCYDKLMAGSQIYESNIGAWPTTMDLIFDDIVSILGLSVDPSVTIQPYPIPYEGTTQYTCNQVLGYIAGCHGGSFRIGRSGLLELVAIAPQTPAETIGTDQYFKAPRLNELKTVTRLLCQSTLNGVDNTFISGIGTEQNTVRMVNPYMTQSILDSVVTGVTGLSYVPVDMTYKSFTWLECGDFIGLEATESIAWEDNNTPWEDEDMRWDGFEAFNSMILNNTFRYVGGLRGQITAPNKSENQSEFDYLDPGIITADNAAKTAYENKAEIVILDNEIQLLADDVDGNSAQIIINANQISQNVTDIDGNTSSINILSNEIDLKVDTDGVINSINISPEGVKISANRLTLTGLVEFQDLYDGSTTISGDNILTGTITANRIATDIAQVDDLLYIGTQAQAGATKEIRFESGCRIRGGSNGVAPWVTISALDVTIEDRLYTPYLEVNGSTVVTTAGNGLDKSGNTLNIDPSEIAGFGIREVSNDFAIDPSEVCVSASGQDIEFQYFSDHLEVRLAGGSWKTLYY